MTELRQKDEEIIGSSQGDALDFMEKNPVWLTTAQVADGLHLKSREKVAKYLRKLEESYFIERRRIVGSNELEYKILTPEEGRKVKLQRLKKKENDRKQKA